MSATNLVVDRPARRPLVEADICGRETSVGLAAARAGALKERPECERTSAGDAKVNPSKRL